MKLNDTHRELYYGALANGKDPEELSEVIQYHVLDAPSTEHALSDLMMATARLTTLARRLGDLIERDHPEWSLMDNVRGMALEEEIDGG